jgi:hypothetical protein
MSGFKKFYVSEQDTGNSVAMQRTINTLQQNVGQALNEMSKVSILNNIIYNDVVINTTLSFEHKLNRKPNGYLIIQKNANAQIWNSTIDANRIELFSSAAVTVSILVF